MVTQTANTPDFLHESSQSGAFCIYAAILTYLQRLLPMLLVLVGEMAASSADEKKKVEILKKDVTFLNVGYICEVKR